MKYWILCNERSGSTLLCDLLNSTKQFTEYDDFRLRDKKCVLQRNRAFGEWLRLFIRDSSKIKGFKENPPYCLKCLRHQFEGVFGEKDADFIEDIFPNVNYILLKRRNIYEHAASVYFTKMISKWHIYNEKEKRKYLKINIPFQPDVAIQSYKMVTGFKNNWLDFLGNRKPFEIFYEDLIENPESTIFQLLSFFRLPTVEKVVNPNRVLRMTRPESEKYGAAIKQLINKSPMIL